MNYQETITYLFNSAPLFQNIGKGAYKEGLYNTLALDEYFHHPHTRFSTIHIAGTNGKGSCSHTLAAILQSAGYKVGLYTSPHLVDFRERIRINGIPVSKNYVIDFISLHKHFFESLHPSFFELTTAMAFSYFAQEKVDVAIIEVGLGGRLDCTNIIYPDLSIITNISFDHVQFLGHTLTQIATEKAGIIKEKTPVVIGEANEETRQVFTEKAQKENAPIFFAEDHPILLSSEPDLNGGRIYQTQSYGTVRGELGGLYQDKNTNTILTAINCLKKAGYPIDLKSIQEGFARVCHLTGLQGRWQKLADHPLTICDTGHNIGGIQYTVMQLQQYQYRQLHIIIGMVNDKDVSGVLSILPPDAIYYFTQASVKRALPAEQMKETARKFHLNGEAYNDVRSALQAARENTQADDLIFIGGSTFIVADLLSDPANF